MFLVRADSHTHVKHFFQHQLRRFSLTLELHEKPDREYQLLQSNLFDVINNSPIKSDFLRIMLLHSHAYTIFITFVEVYQRIYPPKNPLITCQR